MPESRAQVAADQISDGSLIGGDTRLAPLAGGGSLPCAHLATAARRSAGFLLASAGWRRESEIVGRLADHPTGVAARLLLYQAGRLFSNRQEYARDWRRFARPLPGEWLV